MSLTIIYRGNEKDSRRLIDSCKPRGLKVIPFDAVSLLEAVDTEYVILADGDSVIAMREELVIVDLLKGYGDSVVIAGDRSIENMKYPERPAAASSDYCFPNPVLFGGKRESVDCLRTLNTNYHDCDSPQLQWTNALASKAIPAAIDEYCNLFQPVTGEILGCGLIVDPQQHLLQNTTTGAFPCFIYFTGKDKADQMLEFEEWSK